MKAHTQAFKDNVCLFGRELDSIITYTLNDESIELGSEELNSVSPHYQGSILKSVMRQLDIDSNIEIPVGTELNYQFGVKIGENEYGNVYDYIDFGNYIVYSVEKQEDTGSYKIICYDKMLYSMKDYESMDITYPITIRDYISAICNHLGLTFKSINDTFANYNKQIQTELYLDSEGNSLGYTFRDVLDELAQATASTICINEEDDGLEVRYINDTNDTIDGEYLKDINVNFGEKYGKVNSIVLARAGGSDIVYLRDEESVTQNGLCEIKIEDNQIMNFNDRDTYLPDILYRLDGLEYYLNDFSSTGITYYNLCDRYNVEIGEETYSCVMFNDEINVTQGLEENIYTELPKESETDYTKADKTDRRINQTYLIVDKQNQVIESVVNETVDMSNPESIAYKQSKLTQRVGELESRITEVADITKSAEDTDAQVELDDINESEPIQLKVHPITQNISYDYPHNDYPQNDYSSIRIIRFHNNDTNEDFDYELPEDLLYYDSEHYDEFLLDYGNDETSKICQVTKRCKWNADGSVGLLATPEIHNYPYPSGDDAIYLTDGDYVVSIVSYGYGYIFARLMAKNIYTTQFYTKAETNTLISQTAQNINIGVDTKLTNYATTTQLNSAISLTNQSISAEVTRATTEEGQLNNAINSLDNDVSEVSASLELKVDKNDNDQVVSMINASADEITLNANRFSWNSTNSSMTKNGELTANKGKIGGYNISSTNFSTNISKTYTFTQSDLTTAQQIISGQLLPTQQQIRKYDVNGNGFVDIIDLVFIRNIVLNGGTKTYTGTISINNNEFNEVIKTTFNNEKQNSIGMLGTFFAQIGTNRIDLNNNYQEVTNITPNKIEMVDYNYTNHATSIEASGIITPQVTQTSLESAKKDFELLNSGLDIIKDIDIYKYHLKGEDDSDKKHIGFVIGDKYKYSQEVTSNKNDGVDIYSFVATCCKAIQEQQKTIEELQKEVNLLKESDK